MSDSRRSSEAISDSRRASEAILESRRGSYAIIDRRRSSAAVSDSRRSSAFDGRRSSETNGVDEKGLAEASRPCERPEDDEAPAGAGNWYLGHCVQRRGVLYPRWGKQVMPVEGWMIGVYGVLYENDKPLPGAIEAISLLKKAGIDMRFCTNTTCRTKESLLKKLHSLGFEDIKLEEIFTPVAAVVEMLKERDLRPYIVAHPDVMADFQGVDTKNPNCVVVGDAKEAFTYDKLNKAFRILKASDNPVLISMGIGKYYAEDSGLSLDVGAFTKLLEWSADCEAEVVGKPDPAFFEAALASMNIETDYGVMIGDDIINDVAGAKAVNIRGVQVRTGKYRPSDEPHPLVRPDGYVDNLLIAAELFLKHR